MGYFWRTFTSAFRTVFAVVWPHARARARRPAPLAPLPAAVSSILAYTTTARAHIHLLD
jgi:hypothetical protein